MRGWVLAAGQEVIQETCCGTCSGKKGPKEHMETWGGGAKPKAWGVESRYLGGHFCPDEGSWGGLGLGPQSGPRRRQPAQPSFHITSASLSNKVKGLSGHGC